MRIEWTSQWIIARSKALWYDESICEFIWKRLQYYMETRNPRINASIWSSTSSKKTMMIWHNIRATRTQNNLCIYASRMAHSDSRQWDIQELLFHLLCCRASFYRASYNYIYIIIALHGQKMCITKSIIHGYKVKMFGVKANETSKMNWTWFFP